MGHGNDQDGGISSNFGAPVAPAWFEAYRRGNLEYPQTSVGIAFRVGAAAMCSLLDGTANLPDFAASNLNERQVDELKQAVGRAHAAYNIPRPVATHPSAESSGHDPGITDEQLRALWRGAVGVVLSTVLNLRVGKRHSVRQDRALEQITLTDLGESDSLSPASIAALARLEQSRQYRPSLQVLHTLFSAGVVTLDEAESKHLAGNLREALRDYTLEDRERIQADRDAAYAMIMLRIEQSVMRAGRLLVAKWQLRAFIDAITL